jgi:hypothetical protein
LYKADVNMEKGDIDLVWKDLGMDKFHPHLERE